MFSVACREKGQILPAACGFSICHRQYMPHNFEGDSSGGRAGASTTPAAGRPPPPAFSTEKLAPDRVSKGGPGRRIGFVPARRREAPADGLDAWRAAADVLVIRADGAAPTAVGARSNSQVCATSTRPRVNRAVTTPPLGAANPAPPGPLATRLL